MSDFDKILKNKFENFERKTPEYVFDNIQKSYPKSFNPGKIKTAITVASIALTVIVAYVLYDQLINTESTQQVNEIMEAADNVSDFSPELIKPVPEKITSTSDFIPVATDSEHVIKTHEDETIYEQETVVLYANIWQSNDTTVCGYIFILPELIKKNNYFIDSEKGKISLNQNNQLVLESSDSKKIELIYRDIENNKVFTDTINIRFLPKADKEILILEDIQCPGDKLVFQVENHNSIHSIEADGGKLNEYNDGNYSVSWDKPGTKSLKVVFKDNSCISPFHKEINVPEQLQANINTYPDYCNTSSGVVNVESLNYDDTYYIFNNDINNIGVFENVAFGNYDMTVLFNNFCKSNYELSVDSYSVIQAKFELIKSETGDENYIFKNQTTVDGRKYQESEVIINNVWYINGVEKDYGNEFEYSFPADGTYEVMLRAYADEYCYDVFKKNVIISETKFLAPNIFTPNDDGIGDYFIVGYTRPIFNFQGIISNRTGEVIYQWSDIEEGWDGRINGINPASEGVYFYILRGEDVNGRIIEEKGTLRLIRD